MPQLDFEQLEQLAFSAAENIININKDVYVAEVKLELAQEYRQTEQIAALQSKLLELLQRNRKAMFELLDAVVRIGEQGKRSRRFMEVYRELLSQLENPNSVSMFSTDPTELSER